MNPKVEIIYKTIGNRKCVDRVYIDGVRAKEIEGSSRRVFVVKDYCIKVYCPDYNWNGNVHSYGSAPHPINQNRVEVQIWKRASKTEYAKYFVPIIAHDQKFKWIVEKRVKNASPASGYPEIITELQQKFNFDAEGQFFVKNKDIIFYDYGFRPERDNNGSS